MLKIAIYGKGGIGKSTTISNLSAAFSKLGYRVMQIGCDPKADSTRTLLGGKRIPTVLDQMRTGEDVSLKDLIYQGDGGVFCIESGGPIPGRGCAGKGIVTAFEKLESLNAFEEYKPDIVFYDVLGDVVCGGFAMPLRSGYSDLVFIVTSGELMSLYAAENISKAVKELSEYSDLELAGMIVNRRNIEKEMENIESFAKETGVSIFSEIPRSDFVQKAEDQGKTVVFSYPYSSQAEVYMGIAKKVAKLWLDGKREL
ncbi:MAG: AAA family ATPase [Tissierellia bacterium]|nr:AAA family ATPase [Tissierellia bacterium]